MCLAAVQEGATAVTGGRRVDGLPGYFMQPTVFAGVTPEMTIAREEVFGPVLAVQVFDEPEEAIALANGTDYGLCAGVYTKDLRQAHWAADRLVAGQVFVNEWFAGESKRPSAAPNGQATGGRRGRRRCSATSRPRM